MRTLVMSVDSSAQLLKLRANAAARGAPIAAAVPVSDTAEVSPLRLLSCHRASFQKAAPSCRGPHGGSSGWSA